MTQSEAHRPPIKRNLLSVIIPCFNEEAVIHENYRRLVQVLSQMSDLDFELLYVDDGSNDGTLPILREIHSSDERVRVISFSRNFGHQMAVSAGLEHAAGDAVVIIDADLQDPPEVIQDMVACWMQGANVAYGVRREREGETRFKLWTASGFYRLLNRMSDTEIPLDVGDFRLMDRGVVEAFLAMPERDRFIRGMVAWVGFNQVPVPYKRAVRFAGRTKYPLTKMMRFATDGILSFSIAPLRFATWVGLSVAALSILGIAYALILRLLTNIWVPGWTLLFTAMLLIGGVQLICLGVIGEYLGRVYGEVKRRPLYLFKERLGFSETTRCPSAPQRQNNL